MDGIEVFEAGNAPSIVGVGGGVEEKCTTTAIIAYRAAIGGEMGITPDSPLRTSTLSSIDTICPQPCMNPIVSTDLLKASSQF